MNFDELKDKAKNVWVKLNSDDEKEDIVEEKSTTPEPLDMRMKMIRILIGFVFAITVLNVVSPSTLTLPLFTVPTDGKINIVNIFPLSLGIYVFYYTADIMGGMCLNWADKLVTGVKNKLPIPTILHNLMIPIVICLYLAYRLYYPTLVSTVLGVR